MINICISRSLLLLMINKYKSLNIVLYCNSIIYTYNDNTHMYICNNNNNHTIIREREPLLDRALPLGVQLGLVQYVARGIQYTVYSIQYIVYSVVQCIVHSVQSIVYSLQSIVYSLQCIVYSVQCIVYSIRSFLKQIIFRPRVFVDQDQLFVESKL